MPAAPTALALVAAAALLVRAGTAAAEPHRVWLLAPPGAGGGASLALLRAELGSQGFVVHERPMPRPSWESAIGEARAAGAFAVVAPAPEAGRAAADVVLLAVAGSSEQRHLLDLGAVAADRQRPAPGLAGVLAVRVSELLRARASELGAFGQPPDSPSPPAARPPATDAAARAPESPASSSPPGSDSSLRPPPPAARPPATDAAARAPRSPASSSPPGSESSLRLELAAIAGWSGAIGATSGGRLAVSWRGPRALCAQVASDVLPFARTLATPGGSVQVLKASAFTEVGYEGRWAGARLAPAAAVGLGGHYTVARGRADSDEFTARNEASLTPAATASTSLGLRVGGPFWLVAGARALYLARPPEIWGDEGRIARIPAFTLAGWVGLRLALSGGG